MTRSCARISIAGCGRFASARCVRFRRALLLYAGNGESTSRCRWFSSMSRHSKATGPEITEVSSKFRQLFNELPVPRFQIRESSRLPRRRRPGNCYRVDSSRRFDAHRAVRFGGGRFRAGMAVVPRSHCVGSGRWSEPAGTVGRPTTRWRAVEDGGPRISPLQPGRLGRPGIPDHRGERQARCHLQSGALRGGHRLRRALGAPLEVLCLDRVTGRVLWERTAYQGVPKEKRHIKSTYANATPATDGRVVVAFFGSQGLYAYSLAGDLLWKRDLGRFDVGAYDAPEFEWGTASSP